MDDRDYWEQYYADRRKPFDPSPFARHVLERYIRTGDSLIDLGCGNGRDSVFFSTNGARVLAIDNCAEEIRFLETNYGNDDLRFANGDVTDLHGSERFDHIYSRFSLHAISRSGQDKLLAWAGRALEVGGHLLLEFRGKENELFGKGEAVVDEPDAFIHDGHYRRFLDLQQTVGLLEGAGFEVIESHERRGFSPVHDEDETFARIIAKLLRHPGSTGS